MKSFRTQILSSLFIGLGLLSLNLESNGQQSCNSAVTARSGDTFTSTPNSGFGAHGDGLHSRWYRFFALNDGILEVTSCGGSTDTRLFVYNGFCNSLNELSNNDDDCGLNERALVQVTSGNTYYIEWSDDHSRSSFSWSLNFINGTVGSTCEYANTITAGGHRAEPSTGNGANGSGTNAEWFKFSPISDGYYWITSCAESVDTRLHVYEGSSCSNLTTLASRDDNCGSMNEEVTLQLLSSKTYYIEWTDQHSSSLFEWGVYGVTGPGNGNDCGTATYVAPGTHTASPNGGGGAEGSGNDASWFKYSPSANESITVSSCGESSDTKLFIYEGSSCFSKNQLHDSDDDCGSNESVTFSGESGKTYYIEWTDEYSSSDFDWILSTQPDGGGTPDQGNNCSSANEIGPGNYTALPDGGFGAEGMGASHATWYSFEPPIDGEATVSSCGGMSDTKLFIYDGSCSSLNILYDLDDECGMNEEHTFSVEGGKTYFVEWTDQYDNTQFNWTLNAPTNPSTGLINQKVKAVFQVFPNPNNGTFSISFENEENIISIELLNLQGQRIYYSENINREMYVGLGNSQPSGTYLLKVNGNSTTTTHKVLVR